MNNPTLDDLVKSMDDAASAVKLDLVEACKANEVEAFVCVILRQDEKAHQMRTISSIAPKNYADLLCHVVAGTLDPEGHNPAVQGAVASLRAVNRARPEAH